MKARVRKLQILYIIGLISVVILGFSLYTTIELSAGRLMNVLIDINSFIGDAIYFSYHEGYSDKEYFFFINNIHEYFHQANLNLIFDELGIYNIDRLELFTQPDQADIALSELRHIQDLLGELVKRQHNVSYGIVISSSIVLITVVTMLFVTGSKKRNHYQNQILRNKMQTDLLNTMEKERNLLSFELHDDLAQKLALINRYFYKPDLNKDNIQILKSYSEEAIQQIRLVSNRLKTPGFNNLSLKDSFYKLFSDFKILTGINLKYSIIGFASLKLDTDATINVYRVVQELLSNAYKHSKAECISIVLIYGHPELIIRYKDNGVGYDPETGNTKGLGMESMRFRLELLNAGWDIQSRLNAGVTCKIRIPV